MTKTLKDLSYFDSSKIDGTVIPSRIGVRDEGQVVVRQAHHPEQSRRGILSFQ